ncbi:MAG: PAS domain S-box protein [Fibrobacteria bacterium]|nr:PAS domain S-box protein [Fibrobacteria bacterium]
MEISVKKKYPAPSTVFERNPAIDTNKESKEALARLLDKLAIISIIFGTVALVFSLWRIPAIGWHPSIFIDIFFYISGIGVFLFRGRTSSLTTSVLLIAIVTLVNLANYLTLGLAHTGFLLLTSCCVFVGALFDLKAGLIFLLFFVIVCLSMVAGVYVGWLPLCQVPDSYFSSLPSWLYHISLSTLFTTLILITVSSIYTRLVHSLNVMMNQQGELKENENQYRLLTENMHDVVFIQDLNMGLIYISPSGVTLFGYSLSGLKKRWAEGIMTPESFAQAQRVFLEMSSKKNVKEGDVPVLEFSFVRKNKTVFPGEMHPVMVLDGNGKLIGWQAMLRDISEMKHSEAEQRRNAEEQEILLRELYHRTKNNMQLINSLLSLQLSYIKDENATRVGEEIKCRIHAMSLVHQQLYQSKEFFSINLKTYISKLCQVLLDTYSMHQTKIDLQLHLQEICVSMDTAIPCGLILNELLINALKYAYTDQHKGTLEVKLFCNSNNNIILSVKDNGQGLPVNQDVNNLTSFGFQIIQLLSERDLHGSVVFNSEPSLGTSCVISFNDVSPYGYHE